MIYPKNLLDLADEVARANLDDIDQAVDDLERRAKRLPEFDAFSHSLIRDALRNIIHSKRHAINVALLRADGKFGGPAKVVIGRSEAVLDAANSYYDYCISGMTLGSIRGEDLLTVANNELARAEGCTLNAKICQRLRRLVPDGKTVREAVKEANLREVMLAVQRNAQRNLI